MRLGKVIRGDQRAFIASRGRPLATDAILRWCYPGVVRFEAKHHRALHRAAPRFAIKVGRLERGMGRPNLWGPRPELLRLIRGDDAET